MQTTPIDRSGACQGLRGSTSDRGCGLTAAIWPCAIKRGPGSPCCLPGGTLRSKTLRRRFGLAGPELPQDFSCLNRAGTGAASSAGKLAMRFDPRPKAVAKLAQARPRAGRLRKLHEGTVEGGGSLLVLAGGPKGGGQILCPRWKSPAGRSASGWPPASTRSRHYRCCASYWSNVPSS